MRGQSSPPHCGAGCGLGLALGHGRGAVERTIERGEHAALDEIERGGLTVARPRPGRVSDAIEIDLPRPRDRQSAAFDFVKRRVLAALDRSLDRNAGVNDREHKAEQGAAMWW